MGFIIFRLIIFLALVWAGIRLLRAYKQKKLEFEERHDKESSQKKKPQQMVQCRFCNIHLPEKDAVRHEKLWFCCHEHRNHFLDQGPDKPEW